MDIVIMIILLCTALLIWRAPIAGWSSGCGWWASSRCSDSSSYHVTSTLDLNF